jgi:hypothetical protein
MNFARMAENLIETIWVGALWSIGYVVAPTLFSQLDSATAGRVAGELFTIVAWLSMVCGVLLFVALRKRTRSNSSTILKRRLVPLMMTLIGVSEWIVRPMMEAARLPDGAPGDGFGLWHGVSALLYLIASLLAIILVAARNSSAEY